MAGQVAKEPWMMTKGEWDAAHLVSVKTENKALKVMPSSPLQKSLSWATPERIRLEYGAGTQAKPYQSRGFTVTSHKDVITKALSEGKPVPPEVLRDYPDLQSIMPQRVIAPFDAPVFGMKKGAQGQIVKRYQSVNGELVDVQWSDRTSKGLPSIIFRSLDSVVVAQVKQAAPELQSFEDSRSARSRESDERLVNSVTLDPDDPAVSRWLKDPGGADIRGIDTPRKKRRVKPAARRREGSTEVRGMR